jgi:uncharacterized short protein YbdD (DUF466 family)
MSETTNTGLEHTDESQSTDPLEQGQSVAAASQESHDSDAIPTKFVGKTAAEIASSYIELEKRLGQLGSAKSAAEKAAADAAQRTAQYEAYIAQLQRQPQAMPQSSQGVDPEAVFEQAWENDGPKQAIKALVNLSTKSIADQHRLAQAHQDTQSYVERMKKENPDFAELMPEMQKVATQFEHLIRPEDRMSRAAVDMVYNIAKAQNISKFAQAEATKIAQQTELTKAKKRQSTSEGSVSSKGESTVDFGSLSREDMKKFLGTVK